MQDPIIQSGDSVLRAQAKPVPISAVGTPEITRVIVAMKKALAPEEHGVAIAAPQIGESLRIFVIAGKAFTRAEGRPDDDESIAPPDRVFINPEITRTSRATSLMSEGCLSVRGLYGSVRRHEKATVRALDEHGKAFTMHGSGLIAQIFQHEIDHLNGTLFIDKAESLDELETTHG